MIVPVNFILCLIIDFQVIIYFNLIIFLEVVNKMMTVIHDKKSETYQALAHYLDIMLFDDSVKKKIF